MWRAMCLALVVVGACKRGGEPAPKATGSGSGSGSGAGPAVVVKPPPDAAAAPPADVPVQQVMSSADDATLDAVHAAVTSRSDGRCPGGAKRSHENARSSAATKIGTDTVVALACGNPGKEPPEWTLGIARYDGITARALGVKHLEVGDVQLDYFLRASATEVCTDYATVAGTTTIKGLAMCAPLDVHQAVVVTDRDPIVPADALPVRTRTEDDQPAASAALVADVPTCGEAKTPLAPSYTAAIDGDILTIAASCGDTAAHRGAVGIYQIREGVPGRLVGTVVHEADDLVPTAIRVDAAVVCVDYTTRPDGAARVFCARRKP
jgi:hypothetical protein